MKAILNENGYIVEILYKIPPGSYNSRKIVDYLPPKLDPKLYQITPIQPVLGDFVEFTIVPNMVAITSTYIAKIDADVDYIYSKAIGNRGPEYTQAEKEALDFQLAGYAGTVPPYVVSWAEASGMSPQAAADSILTQAAAWRSAAALIRLNRLNAKESLRSGLTTDLTVWNEFYTNIKTVLGII